MLIISAPQCDITSSCVDSNVANIHILTCNLMETVEVKLEVNVAKSVDTSDYIFTRDWRSFRKSSAFI